jgi:hypothetical protein
MGRYQNSSAPYDSVQTWNIGSCGIVAWHVSGFIYCARAGLDAIMARILGDCVSNSGSNVVFLWRDVPHELSTVANRLLLACLVIMREWIPFLNRQNSALTNNYSKTPVMFKAATTGGRREYLQQIVYWPPICARQHSLSSGAAKTKTNT